MSATDDQDSLREQIADWLAITQDVEVPTGLEPEEALERARQLRRLILDGKISPEEVELDEDFKDVLSRLVRLIWDSTAPLDSVVREADAVYQFIRRLPWPKRGFDEQHDLLLECAEAGWGALGYTLSDIDRLRGCTVGESPVTSPAAWSCSTTAGVRMPETATGRILPFPRRQTRPTLSKEEVRARARQYLDTPSAAERSDEFIRECVSDPDVLLTICGLLKELWDASPSTVVKEAPKLYELLAGADGSIGLFDERDFFLGEIALLAGGACRLLGMRDDADLWLDRAEAGFRHTMNPAPLLANVAFVRLALHYDMRRHERVFELLPSLVASFQKLKMQREVFKCRLLEAMSLKESGRRDEALDRLQSLRCDPALESERTLLALVLVNLGELVSAKGQHAEAVSVYQEALSVQADSHHPLMIASLKAAIGEGLRDQGNLGGAVKSYRAAISDYLSLGMQTWAAYLRVVVAETLIASSHHREAEWEILAALPTIEEQKMVPEGFAAVALLRESVRRRSTDQNALRELREHLQATKQQ